MNYSIGEVSELTGLSISTLRYYDREGMFPFMKKKHGGIRVFSDEEICSLETIECLKKSGMPLKDIKQFLRWRQDGDVSLQNRRDMFYEQRDAVEQQMNDLQKVLNTIKFKCWYYDTALANGTEDGMENYPLEDMPKDVREYKFSSSF